MFAKSVTTILIGCSSFCFGLGQERSAPCLCMHQNAPGLDLSDSKSIDFFLDEILKNQIDKECPNYPHFTKNPCLSHTMKKLMAPYLLPKKHPTKSVLDKIFSHSGVIKNKKTLIKAGFKILFSQKKSFIQVVSHPRLKGYLLKLYLDSDRRLGRGPAGWKRLTVRCIVAKKIKRIIATKRIHTFVVADKWLYPLPVPKRRSSNKQPVVLIVKNMNIYNLEQSKRAWRKKASWSTVKGLYKIFSRGYGSAFLSGNIPYTKKHKFAFIDTEFDKRKLSMRHAYHYLSPRMWKYWKSLVNRRGKHMLRMGIQNDCTVESR